MPKATGYEKRKEGGVDGRWICNSGITVKTGQRGSDKRISGGLTLRWEDERNDGL